MELRYKTFIMPHIGDKYSQCADRFAIGKDKNCFAIADGVGESLFPYDWAELVCNDFIANPNLFCEENKLVRESQLIEAWNKKRDGRIANLTETELFIFQMGLEKADFAACTFVGLTVDKNQWQCIALGDSYLFALDEDFKIIDSVASQKGEEFSNFPEYFASQSGKNHGEIVKANGVIGQVAYFVLLTDAISDWFIQVDVEKRKELLAVSEMQSFHSLVNRERQHGNMKDDDTTAVIIEVVHNDDEEIKFVELFNSDIQALIKEEERYIEEAKEAEGTNVEDKPNDFNDEISQPIDLTDKIIASSKNGVLNQSGNNSKVDAKDCMSEDTMSQEVGKIKANPVDMQLLFFEEINNIMDNTKKGMYSLSTKVTSYEFIGKRREINNWKEFIQSINKTINDLNHSQRKIENLIKKLK